MHFALQDDTFLMRSIYDNNTYSLDTSYFVIDKELKKIKYCSARLNVLLIKENGLKIFPKNNISLGFPFYNVGQLMEHTISYEPGDILVVFNEELVNQSGGKHGKKLGMKMVGNMLNNNCKQPWKTRDKYLSKMLQQWTGEATEIEQILIAQIKL